MFERAPRASLGETRTEASHEQTPIPPAAPAPLRAPVAFREVSEHDESAPAEESAHKPVRRRKRGGDGDSAEASSGLQLVETQPDLAPAPTADEEESSRRPVRRRRRGSAQSESGPLQMVETAPGSEGRGDNPPA